MANHREGLELLANELGEQVFYIALPTATVKIAYAGAGEIPCEEIVVEREDGARMTILTLDNEPWTAGHVAPAVDFLSNHS